jgi:ABC-type dipeptide/oligopeptide/nickel transport system ATPase component
LQAAGWGFNIQPIMSSSKPPLLSLRDLRIAFQGAGAQRVEAVRGLDLDLQQGESVAVVGESGSGKSAMALSLARLLPEPAAQIQAQRMEFEGRSIPAMNEVQLQSLRGAGIAYVFQEPTTSLNPVLRVRTQLVEALRLHRPQLADPRAEALHWLERVGITEAASRLEAYPHELSGGMQQRVMIAMALCCRPRLLIADEPTTALDVTIQRQILDLLIELRRELGMSMIFITHNLAIVREVAQRVMVMWRGEVVETGTVEQVLGQPTHPYTKALLHCVPRLDQNLDRLPVLGL